MSTNPSATRGFMNTGMTGFDTAGSANTDLIAKSFASAITRLMPGGDAPLLGLTSRLPRETAVAVEHGFFAKTMLFPQATLGASVASGTVTTFTVTSSANLLPNMILRAASTGENILVNAITSSTTIEVVRGVGSVAAAAISNSVELHQVGTAFEESSTRPNALNNQTVRITNYTQIFRNTWAISESMRATQVIAGEGNVAESKMECMAWHAKDIETASIFGQLSSGTRNGQPFRTMRGLLYHLNDTTFYPTTISSANVTTAGATTNYTQLENALDPVFNQVTNPAAGPRRVLFVGATARKVINKIGRLNGTYQLVDGQTSYGLQFQSFKISRGTFDMIEHPLFNSNSTWSTWALAVDLSTFRLAYLGNRDAQRKDFNQEPNDGDDFGVDAQGGTITSELTCVVKNPPANALITTLTDAAIG